MNRKKFEVITNQPKICSVACTGAIEMFELGRLLSTPDAREALEESETLSEELLDRHARGDWGCISEHDAQLNRFAVRGGLRILSAYKLRTHKTIWVLKRNELHQFAVIPKRWIVERSFAWLEKCRRLWKNCERKLHTSEQFIVLAFLSLLLKRH
jgi:transposase